MESSNLHGLNSKPEVEDRLQSFCYKVLGNWNIEREILPSIRQRNPVTVKRRVGIRSLNVKRCLG